MAAMVNIAAAILHDTIEDTETTYDELLARFGPAVASIVAEVTDDKNLAKAERIRVPTLVVHGDADEIVPFAMGVELAKAIRGAELLAVEAYHLGFDLDATQSAVATAFAPTLSEAKRLGGGGSAGLQRSLPSRSTPPAQTPAGTTISSPSRKLRMCSWQVAVPSDGPCARPLIIIEHEPQMPSRHERRKVSVGSISFLILISASRIIGPHESMSTS